MKLSKRKLESYKRAEMVCQELRHRISTNNWGSDGELVDFLTYWMEVTSKVKFERPKKPRRNRCLLSS